MDTFVSFLRANPDGLWVSIGLAVFAMALFFIFKSVRGPITSVSKVDVALLSSILFVFIAGIWSLARGQYLIAGLMLLWFLFMGWLGWRWYMNGK
jgi:hypothetical protein